MSFIEGFDKATNSKLTDNGALAYNTTGSKLVDFFATVGCMRKYSEDKIIACYMAAREENKELADKIVLYARDIKNGLGERRTSRILLKKLAELEPEKVKRNLSTFVELGRWDDLYALRSTKVEDAMWEYLRKQFYRDLADMKLNNNVSLLGKWLKSINTSSAESREIARITCQKWGISKAEYRKKLSQLRKYIDVVEKKMCDNQWEEIKYSSVPSYAMLRYQNCFRRNSSNFLKYKEDLKNGKEKINSSVLYPYDLVEQLTKAICTYENPDLTIIEEQWKALPNFFPEDKEYNIICCADVSASMNGRPMAASIGLALYCAERNKGAYNGYYLTFTDKPTFLKIDKDESLKQKIINAWKHVGYNTNFNGMLKAIFEIAKKEKEVPDALLVISDEEIDMFTSTPSRVISILDKWEEKFKEENLNMPKIIFWNAANNGTFLEKISNKNVGYISGVSATTFQNIDTLISKDAYEAMVQILNNYEYI